MSNYSAKSIAELSKYIHIDENRIRSSKVEDDLRYRHPAFQSINIPRLKEYLKIFRKHTTYKEELIKARKNVYAEINQLKELMKPPNEDITRRLALCQNRKLFIKRQAEIVNKYYEELRSVVLNEYLSIPNDLHENTPKHTTEILFQSETSSSSSPHDHLTIGKKLNLLNYLNSGFYYLLNDAALLEFATMRFFMHELQTNKFQPFLNPDTCNNFIIDGASDIKNNIFFRLEGNKYTLVGTSSFSSFCALHVGRSVHKKFLPERNVTYGRHYEPQTKFKTEDGLYSVFQRSNVHVFVTSETAEQMNEEFHGILKLLKSIYQQLNVDLQISYQPAAALLLGESLRASIQLYSSFRQGYVEIAHLSMYGDFVSKRLQILCHDKDNNYEHLYLIEGVAVSYPVLLAYLLERSNEELVVPECLLSFMNRT